MSSVFKETQESQSNRDKMNEGESSRMLSEWAGKVALLRVSHWKNSDFYSEWDKKLLDSFEQNDIMIYTLKV